MNMEAVLAVVMFSDLFVAMFFFRLLAIGYASRFPRLFLAGVVVTCVGLLSQSIKNGYVFLFGSSFPIDDLFPLWALKDIGAVICVASFLYYKVRYNRFLESP